ncbi:MAG: DUF4738 domain-containing protein [Prevotella sp.]|nr:DUF4738 domain-containing protein [Prevotella sp.]
MKKVLTAIIAGAIVSMATGCNGKKTDENIITKKVEKVTPSAPVRMQEYEQTKDIKWLGTSYRCEIRRIPDDSLAMVKDETGQEFVDNRITLTILRNDGSIFFSKPFTKTSFDACLDNDYRKTGILEGLVFDRVDGSSLVFAASVSHPQTDEYIPLVMRISRMGDVSMARDTQMDTSAEEEEEI